MKTQPNYNHKLGVKWLTLENETGERLLKQHGLVSRICKDKYTGDPYPANISLCGKLAASEGEERSMPWIRLESEPLKRDVACKRCLTIFDKFLNHGEYTALVVKQDGKVYVMNMPDVSCKDIKCSSHKFGNCPCQIKERSALSSAVLCADQEQARTLITGSLENGGDGYFLIPNLTFQVVPASTARILSTDGKHKTMPLRGDVALLSLQEKTCKHRYDGQSIDGKVYCHWCGEVEEKTEKQEPDFKQEMLEAMKYCLNKTYTIIHTKNGLRSDLLPDAYKLRDTLEQYIAKLK
jgi:hypothetical protein